MILMRSCDRDCGVGAAMRAWAWYVHRSVRVEDVRELRLVRVESVAMDHQSSFEFCACRCQWGIDGVCQEPLGPWCKRSESEPERPASGVLSPSPERTRCTSIVHNFD